MSNANPPAQPTHSQPPTPAVPSPGVGASSIHPSPFPSVLSPHQPADASLQRWNNDPNRHAALPPQAESSHATPIHPSHASTQPHSTGRRMSPYDKGYRIVERSPMNGSTPATTDERPAPKASGSAGYWRQSEGASANRGRQLPTLASQIHGAASSGGNSHGRGADQAGRAASPAAVGLASGIKLNFKRPQQTQDADKNGDSDPDAGEGRAGQTDSPGSAAGSGKKRRRVLEVAANPGRSSRSRNSTPPVLHIHAAAPHPAAAQSQPSAPGPSMPGAQAAQPNLPASLHIFAPPPDPSLPQALQELLPSSSSSRPGPATHAPQSAQQGQPEQPDANGDTLMREAGEGFESRRSGRARQPVLPLEPTRAGVNASGKGVKVGNLPKDDKDGRVPRKKGKRNVDIPNQDFCSACRGVGKFLCCDGCPRSFHFMCLEPPLQIDELPEEETWYCKECAVERAPKRLPSPQREPRPVPTVFKQLVRRVEDENPSTFKLPLDIRQYFAGISTDARGNYVDQEETRTKYDRKGFMEERDGTRLRDAKARPVSCYVCGGSSMPLRSHTTDPESTWRQIVSCDYCALHWHLDCLSPPLASMPNAGRKWMCPNHAEQVMNRKRTVRGALETVVVDSRGMRNNGNISILPDEEARELLEYEDMVINKKKYRVPERIIRLDFWDKLGLGKGGKKVAPAKGGDGVFKRSSTSSDLTDNGSESDLAEDDEDDEGDDVDVAGVDGEKGLDGGDDEAMSIDAGEQSLTDTEAANIVLSLLQPAAAASTITSAAQTAEQSQPGSATAPHSDTPSTLAGQPEQGGQADSSASGGLAGSNSNGSNGGSNAGSTASTPRITLKMPRVAL